MTNILSKPFLTLKDIKMLTGKGRVVAERIRNDLYEEAIRRNEFLGFDRKAKEIPTHLYIERYGGNYEKN